MCSPLGSSLKRQPQPAPAETEVASSSSVIEGVFPVQPPSDLDADRFTDTSPFGLCDDLESCVLPPQAVPEGVSKQHCEAARSPHEAPTFRQTTPQTTAHTPYHISSLYNNMHHHRPDCLPTHASGRVSNEGGLFSTVGQLHNRPGCGDGELLKMIEHAQHSMAVAVQCISTAAAAVGAPASDTLAQPQPRRRNTGVHTYLVAPTHFVAAAVHVAPSDRAPGDITDALSALNLLKVALLANYCTALIQAGCLLYATLMQ